VIQVDLAQVLERATELEDGTLLRQWLEQNKGREVLIEVEVAEAPEIMNAEEAAKLLRISDRTARALCREGRLPGEKVGREWRIKRRDVMAYLAGDEQ
jgi:excisionase family DNA binding protein